MQPELLGCQASSSLVYDVVRVNKMKKLSLSSTFVDMSKLTFNSKGFKKENLIFLIEQVIREEMIHNYVDYHIHKTL